MKLKYVLGVICLAALLPACKKPKDTPVPQTKTKTITVKAVNYNNWTYVNLETGEMKSLRDFSAWNYWKEDSLVSTAPAQGSETDINMDWHIAVHRYDIRTNSGGVAATGLTDLKQLTEWPTDGYKADIIVSDSLYMDLTHMMDGEIGYAEKASINTVLSNSIIRTPTHSMPPTIYSASKEVCVLKCKDNKLVKIQITDTYSDTGASGYVTLSYEWKE